jgi:hypothetical protein
LLPRLGGRAPTGAPAPLAGDAPDSPPELAAASFTSSPPNNGARHRRRALCKKPLAVCRAFWRRYPRPSSRPPLPCSPDDSRPGEEVADSPVSLPEDIRPRSRLVAAGAEALSPAELIAVVLRPFPGTSAALALELSGRLLAERDGLYGELLRSSPCELIGVAGIGVARAALWDMNDTRLLLAVA